jgi:hypothetical protein
MTDAVVVHGIHSLQIAFSGFLPVGTFEIPWFAPHDNKGANHHRVVSTGQTIDNYCRN